MNLETREKKKKNRGANKKKAQVSIEFMSIVGFMLLLLIPLIIAYYRNTQESAYTIQSEQLNKIANEITDTAESVYYLGEPSKVTIKAYIPHGVERVEISNKEVVFKIRYGNRTSDIVSSSKVNISGSIGTSEGIHSIVIEAKENYVEVNG